MTYARAFFDLQLELARRVSALSGVPFTRAVLDYTNLYIRFGLGRDFDAANPIWQTYIAGLSQAHDPGEWTARFHTTRPQAIDPPALVASFGCFSYGRLDDERLRLHFHDAEQSGCSPLATECRARRVAELAALLAHAKREGTIRVVGASWLYNLEAYRRLFPPSYLSTAQPLHGRFRHMPLWGQFLDRHGAVRESQAREFRDRLKRQSSLESLDDCFPLQVLRLEAPVEDFSAWYGV